MPMSEQERVERFEAAYNRLDRGLGEIVEARTVPRKHSWASRVRIASNRRRAVARHIDFLLEVGELRNALVHGRMGEPEFIAVPAERVVLELERVDDAVNQPARIAEKHLRRVVTVRPEHTLADVAELVKKDGYSRYPVYGETGFVGLLTSNGIARWSALQVHGGRIEVDATRVRVADILQGDHRRNAVAFVAVGALLDDVDELFVHRRPLEAVIVTRRGRPEEEPLGMMCAADVAVRE